MSDKISKTQRWLDLIALLLKNRQIPATVEEIMEGVPAYAASWEDGDEKSRASVRRMFERDKDELREMGIPIESLNYTVNYGLETIEGYRIDKSDFYLPYLRVLEGGAERPRPTRGVATFDLSPGDAASTVDALRRIAEVPSFPYAEAAQSALAKISFDIDTERFPSAAAIQLERPGTAEVLERLRPLSDAVQSRKRVAFRYHGIRRGEPTDREVEPYALFLQRDWYLVGRDIGVDALRTFRVSRMDPPTVNERSPKEKDFELPADFDVRDYLGRRAWELGTERATEVDVLFTFPRSLLAERNGDGVLIETRSDGSAVRRFAVVDPEPFLRWMLGMAGEATILAPPDMREAGRQLAQAVLSLYEGRDG